MSTPVEMQPGARPETDVTFQELVGLLKDPTTILVDVLPRESYVEAHIDGAISLPVAEITTRAPEVLQDRGRTIIAYCGSFT